MLVDVERRARATISDRPTNNFKKTDRVRWVVSYRTYNSLILASVQRNQFLGGDEKKRVELEILSLGVVKRLNNFFSHFSKHTIFSRSESTFEFREGFSLRLIYQVHFSEFKIILTGSCFLWIGIRINFKTREVVKTCSKDYRAYHR